MTKRIQSALSAVGLDTFSLMMKFQENGIDDQVMENLVTSTDSSSSSSPSPQIDLKTNPTAVLLRELIPNKEQCENFVSEFIKSQLQSNSNSSSNSSVLKSASRKRKASSSYSPRINDHQVSSSTSPSRMSTPNSSSSSNPSTNPNPNTSPMEPKDLQTVIQEAAESSLKFYTETMENLLNNSGLFYDDDSILLTMHKETKTKSLTQFLARYTAAVDNFCEIQLKSEDGLSHDQEVKEKLQTKNKQKINITVDELETNCDDIFEKVKMKNTERKAEFRRTSRMSLQQAEDSYTSRMTELMEGQLSEEEVMEKEKELREMALNTLKTQISLHPCATSSFIQEKTDKLTTFLEKWFEGHFEIFQLRKDEDNLIIKITLPAAKDFYNKEMEKKFEEAATSGSGSGFFHPDELEKIHEETLTAAIRQTQEENPELTVTERQDKLLRKALKTTLFSKFEERNKTNQPNQLTSPAIGIDLGTTYSCVAVYRNGKVEVIHNNENGNKTTPSYVSYQHDGAILAGETAKKEAYGNPENTIFDSKRLIGRRFEDVHVQQNMKLWPFTIVEREGRPKIQVRLDSREASTVGAKGAKRVKKNKNETDGDEDNPNITVKEFFPEQVSAQVLVKMKQIAEDYLGTKVKNAVITVPALFNDAQRQATRDAGEIAGLNVLRIINEPTAAAISYQVHRQDELHRNVLVFDLGGGTFDVAVLQIYCGDITVKSVHGDTNLGGQDFDAAMVKYCIEEFKKENKIDLARESNKRSIIFRKIQNECEAKKKILSFSNSTTVWVYSVDSRYKHLDLKVPFTRELFESLNRPHFDRCIQIVEQALEEAQLDKCQINDVVLVGGSTRIPMVQQMLSDYFDGKSLCRSINPDEAVAMGAAIQACILNGEQVEVQAGGGASSRSHPIQFKDVTPLSIGVKKHGGVMSVVIEKNSPVPTETSQAYSTNFDNQDRIHFEIFEGEEKLALSNNLLGSFHLKGIPKNKAKREIITVTMAINEEGILNVKAVCNSNKQESEITITAYRERMSRTEIEEARDSSSSSRQ